MSIRVVRLFGVATAYAPAFFEELSESPIAAASGVNFPVPGISLAPLGSTLPSGTVLPSDSDDRSRNVVAAGGAVAISPVAGIPEPIEASISGASGFCANKNGLAFASRREGS